MHHQVNPECFSSLPSQPHLLLIDIIRRFTKVNDFGLIKLLALSPVLSFLVWTYIGSYAWIDGSGRAYGGEGAIIGDDAWAGGDDSISKRYSGVHNKADPLQINFFEEIAQIFEEPSAHEEPSADNEPSGYNDGESPADMAEEEGLLTSDEGSFDAPLWDDPSEGSDSSLNYLGANSIAGSVMGTAGVVATRLPARTLLRGHASRGTHRWLIPGVVLGAGLGYLYKNTQRSQLHASLQGGRASVATPSASSYARASASASEPPSSSQRWIIQSPSPEDPRVADVEPFEATPQEIEFFSVITALDGADEELSPDVHRGVQEKVLEELSDGVLRVRGLQLQFREKLLKAHGSHLPSKAQNDIARVDSLVRTYINYSVRVRGKLTNNLQESNPLLSTSQLNAMILVARLVKKKPSSAALRCSP